MTKKDKDEKATIEKTSGGGHIGGTHSGQRPDAKTSSGVNRKGDKARPNDGSK
jgi:hypothetical protein